MLHYLDNIKLKIILLTFIISANSYAQQSLSSSDKDFFSIGDKLFYEGEFLKALEMYERIWPKDTANIELNYKMGVSNYEIKKFRKKSLQYFKRVKSDDFPEANYYLGVLYHAKRDYANALSSFAKYKNTPPRIELDHNAKEVDELIEKCYTARLFELSPDPAVKLENMGTRINSAYADYSPLLPADESFIMFTSRRKNEIHTTLDTYGDNFEDIYISNFSNGNYQPAMLFDTTINSSVHDACTGLSMNGESVLFFRTSADMMSGDVYETVKDNNTWLPPTKFGNHVNSPFEIEPSACYSPDNNTIIFSSNRFGGLGGFDLFITKKDEAGNWSEAVNLGPIINTPYNEDAPFISALGDKLYFSSQGHKNMGGYDVFVVDFAADGKFKEPQNLGFPINSVNDDIFFVVNADHSKAYFSTEREDGFGMQDIYKVSYNDKQPVSVYDVFAFDNAETKLGYYAVKVVDVERPNEIKVYKPNSLSGKITLAVDVTKTYQVSIESFGHEAVELTNYKFGLEKELKFTLKKNQ
jgi:tetratricopeptide (TPR) repeat protein